VTVKAAARPPHFYERAVPCQGGSFCERCGYTSIRAQGTKGWFNSSVTPSPNRPRRTPCGHGL